MHGMLYAFFTKLNMCIAKNQIKIATFWISSMKNWSGLNGYCTNLTKILKQNCE